ncbi:UNVERIFIED_CONTAM: hypothetical protein Scaly_1473900 [Sesamum calycinum]|uniref:Reverse transcriptase n=1 Tax=Sesamum calycinum TaxID=2727403 RepID=A0AAW2PRW1_9LAMI
MKRLLNMQGLGVDAIGKSGGLGLCGLDRLLLILLVSLTITLMHIYCCVIKGVIGISRASMVHLRGDFNTIVSELEKESFSETPAWEMRHFRTTLLDSGLSDEQIKRLRLEFDQLCSAEEIKWKQRGRQHGLPKRIEILLYAKASQQWLKPFLNSIISPSQSAFIHGSLITDNVLVAFEVNHFLKGERGSKSGHVVIKLDMSKVYDIE